MTYIKSITLSKELDNYKFNEKSNVLKNISRMNIFIGGNNSGKILIDSECKDIEQKQKFKEYMKSIFGK